MRILLPLGFILVWSLSYAHPGGLDSNCGHTNRKTGEYHYHPTWKSCRTSSSAEVRTTETVIGTVMEVKDGDTIVISPADGGQFFTCRLYGIDTPEMPRRGKPGQPEALEAKKEMKSLVLGQTVRVRLTGDKTYDREVCLVEKDGVDINLEMVKRGYAWAYKRYLRSPYASEYIEAEGEARKQGIGLWQHPNPEPPWEYRRRYR